MHSHSSITLVQSDVSAAADMASLPAWLAGVGCPAASFIHTAGVLADKLLASQTLPDARTVFAPKLAGLAAAQSATQHQPLQQLLLFSSISAALGNRGQANYAAPNATLDAMASAMAASGAAITSVQWGAWAGAGMAAQPLLLARLQKQGEGSRHLHTSWCQALRTLTGASP
jgi:hypothetical protein